MASLLEIEKTLTIHSAKDKIDPWYQQWKLPTQDLIDKVGNEHFDQWDINMRDREGRTVRLIHNRQGTEEDLFTHLTTAGDDLKQDRVKATWVPFIPRTIEKAHYVLEDGNREIYVCLYRVDRDVRRHLVVVDRNEAERTLDLWTHFSQEYGKDNKQGKMTARFLVEAVG